MVLSKLSNSARKQQWAFGQTKAITESLSFDLCTIPLCEPNPGEVWPQHPQCLHATLPPTLDSREASEAMCVSQARQLGTHCSHQLSAWQSTSTRCGLLAGTGNSASPDAWGGEKSVCLQHKVKIFNLIKHDMASSFLWRHCTRIMSEEGTACKPSHEDFADFICAPDHHWFGNEMS